MDLVGTVVPLALVVGLSPLPIMPAVLLLMSERGRAKAGAFVGAWGVALTVLAAAALLLGRASQAGPASDDGVGWIQLVTGLAFLGMAGVKWLRRPAPGSDPKPPAWMSALGSYTPRQAARLGAVLAAANPKNVVMALAAGAEIALLTEAAGEAVAGIAVFVLVGSLGVGGPWAASAVLGERATPALVRGKAWLDRNSTALGVGVLVVLGALLVAKGLPGLL